MSRQIIEFTDLKLSNEEMVGKTFGWLTVLEILKEKRRGSFLCLCKCKCGNLVKHVVSYIRIGRSKSCGCSHTYTSYASKYIIDAYWYGIKDNQYRKTRVLEFSITPGYLDKLWELQKGKCFFTGIELKLPSTANEYLKRNYTSSVDRIDSSKGYIEGNVCWVHKRVNAMKMDLDNHEFITLCKAVHDNAKIKT